MPRPSKRVSPDTLGGRIRSARQNMRLSLADVAGQKYSTSLISQIERNRVDPSPESLQYLAEQLKLPLKDLVALAQQHRESETEAHRYKLYEEQHFNINRLLANNQPGEALDQLKDLNTSKLPTFLRWRMLALRGQCYFNRRYFLPAQQDFLSAVAVLPDRVPPEHELETVTLRLHLAAATRQLNQLDKAIEYYQEALHMMTPATPLRYVAEAHWGIALVLFQKANTLPSSPESGTDIGREKRPCLQEAMSHAENACTLYGAITEILQAALLQCLIALIEQALGDLPAARKRLCAVLKTWEPTLDDAYQEQHSPTDRLTHYTLKERANVVSAAACYLAVVEREDQNRDEALRYIQLALKAGKLSYILRRAEAYMTLGQILAWQNSTDPEVEAAYREAIHELSITDRLVARIHAHDLLGRHLLKIGRAEDGERELDRARELSSIPKSFSDATPSEDMSVHS